MLGLRPLSVTCPLTKSTPEPGLDEPLCLCSHPLSTHPPTALGGCSCKPAKEEWEAICLTFIGFCCSSHTLPFTVSLYLEADCKNKHNFFQCFGSLQNCSKAFLKCAPGRCSSCLDSFSWHCSETRDCARCARPAGPPSLGHSCRSIFAIPVLDRASAHFMDFETQRHSVGDTVRPCCGHATWLALLWACSEGRKAPHRGINRGRPQRAEKIKSCSQHVESGTSFWVSRVHLGSTKGKERNGALRSSTGVPQHTSVVPATEGSRPPCGGQNVQVLPLTSSQAQNSVNSKCVRGFWK